MRIIVLSPLLLLAACSPGPDNQAEPQEEAAFPAGIWRGGDRDGLCVAGDGKAALVVYGSGNANCMARGTIEKTEGDWVLVPRGDQRCRIPIEKDGNGLRAGRAGTACAYYCGGDAQLDSQTLLRSEGEGDALVDGAGEPLC